MKKRFWQFRAAAEAGVGELLIYGPISDVTWYGDEVTPAQFREDLQALGDVDEIRVYINSPGGDVFAGQTIHSMLVRHPATITVYVDGLAASAASLIAMAGDVVIMPKNAMMMVHNPSALVWGAAEDMRHMADALDKIRDSMVAAYRAKTGLDDEQIIELLDAETWMTAEEAVELGFADKVEEAKRVAASIRGDKALVNGVELDLSRYRNAEKARAILRASQSRQANEDDVSATGAPKRAPVGLYERRVRVNERRWVKW